MQAFNMLVLGRGYGAVMPADVAEAAGVARSTLYEHFAGKEEMLQRSLLPILQPLAECVGSHEAPPGLEFTLEHIRCSRTMARELLGGRARTVAARTLAQLIEAQLPQLPAGGSGMPRPLMAACLAGAILALIEEWLTGREACPVPVLAGALQASTHAAASAWSRP